MSFESITEIWTYCTQRNVVWEHYRNLNLLHSTMCRLRALQESERIALNEMSFESITEIWTYCTVSFESRNLKLLHSTIVVWEHYRNLNLLHSTRCRLTLQKSELIALMSFESITEIWTYCTQRCVVWEHYRNLNVLHLSHYRNLNVLHSTGCRFRALQKSEPIAVNEIVLGHYLNLLHSTRCRFRALQKSERIALNKMSFESITDIWTYCTQRNVVWEHYRNLNLLLSTRCRFRALQKSELIALDEMSFEGITEIWTYCT